MVDECAYRDVHASIGLHACVFEKTLTADFGHCSFARQIWLADRVNYKCNSAAPASLCQAFIGQLRQHCQFIFKIEPQKQTLPHGKMMQLQCGGLLGLTRLLEANTQAAHVTDIHSLICAALAEYSVVDQIPFNQLLPSIAAFKIRRRKKRAPRT